MDTQIILKSKILIVDNNPVNISILEELLRVAGYGNIMTITDSRETLQLFNEYKPDLILLNLRMPNLDGFQVIEQLNEVNEEDYLPIIVITADNDQENRLKAVTMGARDSIVKPFDYAEVLMRIKNMLEIHVLHNDRKRV